MPAKRYCVNCGKSLSLKQSPCPRCGSYMTTHRRPDSKIVRERRAMDAATSLVDMFVRLLRDSEDEQGRPFGYHTIARFRRLALHLTGFGLLTDFKVNAGRWMRWFWLGLYYSFFPLSLILVYLSAVEHWPAVPKNWFVFWRWPFDLAALPMDLLLFLLVCIGTTILFFLLDSFLCHWLIPQKSGRSPSAIEKCKSPFALSVWDAHSKQRWQASLYRETAWKFCDWRDRYLLSGIVDELAYRVLFFSGALVLLAGLNILCFGAFEWLYLSVGRPLADLVTFHLLHSYLYQSPWTIGAAMLIAQGQFWKSREFTLSTSRSQTGWQCSSIRSLYSQLLLVWLPGMFFFLFLFKYGILLTILLHILYDLLYRLLIIGGLKKAVEHLDTKDSLVEDTFRKARSTSYGSNKDV
ncbi:hypothetical protein EPA93_14125 [Ktedonosporobacter rubrisoli]|uniref:Uncharacterized protein n=1 Tax=Ktedonosporobacter rubrisoli TaxID=2509675 RepID=A0A4P6JPL3_KTERU|nr:hypothetical protein [Ktedonosporobacter rubrisoli]QBD77080.1 hypothetical protein EPA93_14125 [Ktedonosporobacter rubrisoli]